MVVLWDLYGVRQTFGVKVGYRGFYIDVAKRSGQSGCESNGLRVILNELKMGLGQSGYGLGRVDPYFSHEFFFFFF